MSDSLNNSYKIDKLIKGKYDVPNKRSFFIPFIEGMDKTMISLCETIF